MSDQQHYKQSSKTGSTRGAGDCPTCHCPIDPDSHGWFQDRNGHLTACPTCSPPVLARRRALRLQAFAAWDAPAGMREWTWETWGAMFPAGYDAAALNARAWQDRLLSGTLDPDRAGLYLWGDFGLGKTGLAVSILHAARVAGLPAAFMRVMDLLDNLRASYRAGDDSASGERVRAARTADLLLLDDLGAERPTGWVLEQLCALIEDRKSSRRATIFTCNFSLTDLLDAWDDATATTMDKANAGRIVSRLDEFCEAVAIDGPYLRRRSGQKGGAR